MKLGQTCFTIVPSKMPVIYSATKFQIPLNWAVVMNEPDAGGEHTMVLTYANRIRGRGMLRNSY